MTNIYIPAHRGSGDNDYLWDFGFRRGEHTRLNRFINRVCGDGEMAASFDDDPAIVQGGYIEADTTRPLTAGEIRRAATLHIIVNLQPTPGS